MDSNDFNGVMIYHQRSTEAEEHIKQFIADVDKLLVLCDFGYHETTEYDQFVRCLLEQTSVENGKLRPQSKENGRMKTFMIQNSFDSEVVYRRKVVKEYWGYAVNLEEFVGENDSVVTEYQYDSRQP